MISQHDSVLQAVFCPQLFRNVRSRRRFDSSSIIAHPVHFDIQQERSLKYDAKNSTFIYMCIDINLSAIDIGFLYQFNLRLHQFSFYFNVKEKTFFKSWQVCDWLAKWLIMFGFMDLRRPRVVRRSNVGLVTHCFRTSYVSWSVAYIYIYVCYW